MTAEELSTLLDELGQRLGPAGEHVFALAVRQVYVVSAAWLIVGVLVLIATAFAWQAIRRYIASEWARWNALPEHEKNYPSLNGKPTHGAVLLYLVPVASGLLGLWIVLGCMVSLLNPEYAAIRDLIGTVR